ncbi:MAG: imelysin family protein [Myxococcota bacterium]
MTRFLYGLVLISSLACGGSDAMVEEDALRQQAVRDFVDVTLTTSVGEARTALLGLQTAAQAYAEAPTADTRSATQEAWRQAIAAWQVIEAMAAGPLGAPEGVVGGQPGGQDLRDAVYSWPATNACSIDRITVADTHADVDALAEANVNVRGLDALEYILFDDDLENDCSRRNPVNADGIWEAERANLEARRARYSATIATLLVREFDAVDTALESYSTTIRDTPNEFFPSAQEGLNSISDALFYIDNTVRDVKSARIAGVAEDAGPEGRESLYANVSISHIRANVVGFQRAFNGMEGGVGFADLLEDVGATDLTTRMNQAIDTFLAEADATGLRPVEDVLAEDANGLTTFHDNLRAITTLFKSEFLSVLDLEEPDGVPVDND